MSNILKKNNLYVEKVVSQSKFLQTMGIIRRANIISKKMNFKLGFAEDLPFKNNNSSINGSESEDTTTIFEGK